MIGLTAYILLFLFVAVFFVFIHLVMGRMIRPVKPDPDKLTIYECGEPTVGSSWIQFDLRFYVVALLFVVFDVEVVFFFPWAVVFGKSNTLANKNAAYAARLTAANELFPGAWKSFDELDVKRTGRLTQEELPQALRNSFRDMDVNRHGFITREEYETFEGRTTRKFGQSMAWLSFADILVFFGVLLVGFAYLWKRGDLDWVRSTLAERGLTKEEPLDKPREAALVGVGPEETI
jgi:NADH-quinone oxidoreductase subunit A